MAPYFLDQWAARLDDVPAAGKRFPLKADDTLKWGKTELQVKIILKKRTGSQK